MQKEGLNGLESASLRRVTDLVSKSESELSLDMETLFSISDAYHVVSMQSNAWTNFKGFRWIYLSGIKDYKNVGEGDV